jgi:hypothetical protein
MDNASSQSRTITSSGARADKTFIWVHHFSRDAERTLSGRELLKTIRLCFFPTITTIETIDEIYVPIFIGI